MIEVISLYAPNAEGKFEKLTLSVENPTYEEAREFQIHCIKQHKLVWLVTRNETNS